MVDLTPGQIASTDVGYWAAVLNKIELQRGPYSFVNHEFQVEPMRNKNKRNCYKKATRGGFSEIEILKSLHGMIHGKYREGVLYLFPTTDDVQEFSKARFGPLIQKNRQAIGRFVKSAGRGTDTASLKKIGETALLYLRGARLSQKRGDVDESSKMKGIGVDKVVFDEVDHMDDEVIAKARGRYYDSPWQEETFIGNPIVPGEGVDKQWALSDQRYWFRKCGHCGEYTCAKKFFLEDPERCVGIRSDGTGYIACRKCGREVFIRDGEWVPDISENTDYMRGYTWSHLDSMVIDPRDVLRDFRFPPEGNLADVMRLRLGEAYIEAEDRLTRAAVYECCGQRGPHFQHDGPCIMGVDVGKVKHVIIGAKTGKDSYEIYRTIQLSEWSDISDLARKFNVKSAVIDLRPYEDKAREFQKSEKYKIYLCDYKENQPQEAIYNDNTGIVGVNRTEIFDRTHRMVTDGKTRIPRQCEETKEFAKQLCNAYKVLELNKRTMQKVYRYRGTNEHFRNALNYFLLAARKAGVQQGGASGELGRGRQEFADNNYDRLYVRN